jgi:hypothetical protein
MMHIYPFPLLQEGKILINILSACFEPELHKILFLKQGSFFTVDGVEKASYSNL